MENRLAAPANSGQVLIIYARGPENSLCRFQLWLVLLSCWSIFREGKPCMLCFGNLVVGAWRCNPCGSVSKLLFAAKHDRLTLVPPVHGAGQSGGAAVPSVCKWLGLSLYMISVSLCSPPWEVMQFPPSRAQFSRPPVSHSHVKPLKAFSWRNQCTEGSIKLCSMLSREQPANDYSQ